MTEIQLHTFRKGDQVATIVTDGCTTRTYEPDECRAHTTLYRAIAYLEARGWQIMIDQW